MSKVSASGRFKSYSACLNYLFNLERAGIKYNLGNIKRLLKILGNPEKSFRTIHVAGTNGKGSVASMIYSYLLEDGINAGLYTSPHVIDFRERIIFNGRMAEKNYILDFVERMRKPIEEICPSFFEVTTAMAFDYFRECKAEAAVIETGLGGRLDSTNAVNPLVSVITGISVDHVEYLGNTIRGIAKEKAGIIKKGKPVVVGKLPPAALKQVTEKALEKGSILYNSDKKVKGELISRNDNGVGVMLTGRKYFIPVIGDYQLINAKTAFCTLNIAAPSFGRKFSCEIFERSLLNVRRNAKLQGRFETVSYEPRIIIDVSHNLEAIRNLKKNASYFSYDKLYVLMGMMHDKDYCSCVREVAGIDCSAVLTRPAYSRAADPHMMLNCLGKDTDKFIAFSELNEAVKYVFAEMKRNDMLVVTGSFFLAGEFLLLMKRLRKK